MKKILNLTKFPTSGRYKNLGVFDPQDKIEVQELLTFEETDFETLIAKADALAKIARENKAKTVLIECPSYFVSTLERALLDYGLKPVYSVYYSEEAEEVAGATRSDLVEGFSNIFKFLSFNKRSK